MAQPSAFPAMQVRGAAGQHCSQTNQYALDRLECKVCPRLCRLLSEHSFAAYKSASAIRRHGQF